MAKIENYPVLNFSGGVRRDKSLFELQKNELLDARNIEVIDRGRLRMRRGGQQFGTTLSGTIENSFFVVHNPGGGTPSTQFLVNTNDSAAVISKLVSRRVTTAFTTASTTIVLDASTGLAASGTVEIEGDIITYGSINGSTLETVSGITSNHGAGAACHQWGTLSQSGTAVQGARGVYYAMINDIVIFTGGVGNIKQLSSGGTVSDVSGEPSILFLVNYRDRLYGAGDGASGDDGSPTRVSFSARGDGTSWTIASDYFDVFDQQNEYIMGFKVLRDRLGIFKTNNIFVYDEVELKQGLSGVGAYNQKVIQTVGDTIFTFCPNGIFKTNLVSSKNIGEPVRQYWENFTPAYDARGRVCSNTWAASFMDSYLLYIGDITNPSSVNDVVLEYNTRTESWTVHTNGFANFVHLNGFQAYRFGDTALNYGAALFGGDSGNKMWRLYSNKYTGGNATVYGGDLFKDLLSDTGTPVPAMIETPLYDLTHPQLFKKFSSVRFFAERGVWSVEYRVENEESITQYRPLGVIRKPNDSLRFPTDAAGYRVGFRISAVNTGSVSIFNGLVIEDTEVLKRS